MFEEYDRKIPDYYPTMYMDGYEPYQILHALHRKMIRDYEQREEAKRKAKEEADNVVIPTINFNTSAVKKEVTADSIEHCWFSRTVRADNSYKLALLYKQTNIIQNLLVAKTFRYVAQLDDEIWIFHFLKK